MNTRDFSEHKLTIVEPYSQETGRGEYTFANPGSNFYSLVAIFRKDTIIFYGDIRPCVILSQQGIDMAWLKKAIKGHLNYFFEKVITDIKPDYDEKLSKVLALQILKTQFIHEDAEKKIQKIDWRDEESAEIFYDKYVGGRSVQKSFESCGIFINCVKEMLKEIGGTTMIGPFSLSQAERILSTPICEYCGHKLGVKDPVLDKKMCSHQFQASEVITKHRKLAEGNLEFTKADEMLAVNTFLVKRVIDKHGCAKIVPITRPGPGFIAEMKVVERDAE